MTETMEPIPKEQAAADISIFAEYISQLKPDPNCRVGGCFGRGYLGFQMLATKDGPRAQLLTCKCTKPGETEYVRLQKQLDQGLGFIHASLTGQLQAIQRRTFWGAFEYLYEKIKAKFARKGKP
jgi:hypothetical protein